MIVTSVDNIEEEKPHPPKLYPSSADHITIVLHYYSIKFKSFILKITAISDVVILCIRTYTVELFALNKNLQLDVSKSTLLAELCKTENSPPLENNLCTISEEEWRISNALDRDSAGIAIK